jgi:hypothetical protein
MSTNEGEQLWRLSIQAASLHSKVLQQTLSDSELCTKRY